MPVSFYYYEDAILGSIRARCLRRARLLWTSQCIQHLAIYSEVELL